MSRQKNKKIKSAKKKKNSTGIRTTNHLTTEPSTLPLDHAHPLGSIAINTAKTCWATYVCGLQRAIS